MRNRSVIRIEAVYRFMMLRLFHRVLRLIVITEYPKSGASWLAQMLHETTGYPFPRQQFPRFGKAIYHGHYIEVKTNGPIVVFWRDPRDIMVSWYYHTMFYSNKNHPEFVDMYRRALGFQDIEDIGANLSRFIDFNFTTPLSPRFTFNDYFDYWYKRSGVVECRYENLKEDPVATLYDLNKQLGFEVDRKQCIDVVERYSFERLSMRKPGQEDSTSYLRKGIVGDWKNYFSEDAKEVFSQCIGDRLQKLGYEQSNDWVKM